MRFQDLVLGTPEESGRCIIWGFLDGQLKGCVLLCTLRGGSDGEAAGLGDRGDVDVEPLARVMGEWRLFERGLAGVRQ